MLFALSKNDTFELTTSCLKCLMYSDDEWSLTPSMNENLRSALSRPIIRSTQFVIPREPLWNAYNHNVKGKLVRQL